MKLRIVTLNILLASGLFSLTLQAQLVREEGVLRSARRAENERENFELVNNANADIYYSVGVEDDPTLRAENFQLRQLRPLGIISGVVPTGGAVFGGVPTNQRVEVIATRQEPQNRTYTVRLFSFTPSKDIFVQTVNRGGIIYIEPQPRRYLGLFGTSATGRDLRNNVTQKDIRSRDIDYTPKRPYTPGLTPQGEEALNLKAKINAVLQDISARPGMSQAERNELEALKLSIATILTPGATATDIFRIPAEASPEAVTDAQERLIRRLSTLNIPERDNLIDIVNKRVAEYLARRPEFAAPVQPTRPRPGEPSQIFTPPKPVIPEPSVPPLTGMERLRNLIQTERTLAGKVGLGSNASSNAIVDRTIYIIDLLNQIPNSAELISILQKALDDYLEAQPAPTRPTTPTPTIPVQPQPSLSKEVAELLKESERISQLSLEALQALQKRQRDLVDKFEQTTFPSTEARRQVYQPLQALSDLIIKEIQNRLKQPALTPAQPSPVVPSIPQIQPAVPSKPVTAEQPVDPSRIPLSQDEMDRITGSDTIHDMLNIINPNATPENVDINYRLYKNRIDATPRTEQIKQLLRNALDSAYQKYLKDIAPKPSPTVPYVEPITPARPAQPTLPITLPGGPAVAPEAQIPTRPGTKPVLPATQPSPIVTPEQRVFTPSVPVAPLPGIYQAEIASNITQLFGKEAAQATPEQIHEMYLKLKKRIEDAVKDSQIRLSQISADRALNNIEKIYGEYLKTILPAVPEAQKEQAIEIEELNKEIAELRKESERISQLSMEEIEALRQRRGDLLAKFKETTFPSDETRREVFREVLDLTNLIIKKIDEERQRRSPKT